VKNVIAFSGGIQSSYMTLMLVKELPKSSIILLFHDTKTEPSDNYRFRREISEYIGIPITEFSDGRDIWQVFDDENFLGNNRIPICSMKLKVIPAQKFYKKINDDFVVYIGYNMYEHRRAQKICARYPKIKYKFPLLERKISMCEIISGIKSTGITLPKMYKHFKHANCVPCARMGKSDWRKVKKFYPDRFKKALEYEKKFGHSFMKNTYLKDLDSM